MINIYYTILCFISIVLILYAYKKIRYGFWFYQPVYHYFNWAYCFSYNKIICRQLDYMIDNKYYNNDNILTQTYASLPPYKKTQVFYFIKNFANHNILNSNQNKKTTLIKFLPDKNAISRQLTFNYGSSKISLYNKKNNIISLKKGTIQENKKMCGLLVTTPLQIYFNTYSIVNTNKNKINIYDNTHNKKDEKQLDFVKYWIDDNSGDSNVKYELLQSHYYNGHNLSQNKSVTPYLVMTNEPLYNVHYLFKTDNYIFNNQLWEKPSPLAGQYTILKITKQNIYLFRDFLESKIKNKYDITIFSHYSHLSELIEKEDIYIYIIIDNYNKNDNINCLYVFKKSYQFIDNKELFKCISSINNINIVKKQNSKPDKNPELNLDVFITGFKCIYWELANKYKFGFGEIANLGDNDILISQLKAKNQVYQYFHQYYYFYNYVHKTRDSKKIFYIE